jgi:hypothetical protein
MYSYDYLYGSLYNSGIPFFNAIEIKAAKVSGLPCSLTGNVMKKFSL